MNKIFHEKQEGSLCAQHCLNALLQGPYFTAVDLGTLAQNLDDEERNRMAESGLDSEDYRRFISQPSGNMDDSGYFSVQVITKALDVWGLDLITYSSSDPEALRAKENPSEMSAFICNYKDHWLTIRKIGNQWFNLNSLLSRPQYISDTYLALFLAQLQQEGYSIFVVQGSLPSSPAEAALLLQPYVPPPRQTNSPNVITISDDEDEDEELKAALALSLKEDGERAGPSGVQLNRGMSSEDEDAQLKKAMELSLSSPGASTSAESPDINQAELNKALRMSLGASGEDGAEDQEEEEELHKALRLSLECRDSTAPSVDPEEVQRKRLAYLDAAAKPSS